MTIALALKALQLSLIDKWVKSQILQRSHINKQFKLLQLYMSAYWWLDFQIDQLQVMFEMILNCT